MADRQDETAQPEASGSATESAAANALPSEDFYRHIEAAAVRPVLQAIARLIATDRRAVLLATERTEILLANAPANRLGLGSPELQQHVDWAELCTAARKAGSVAVSITLAEAEFEGEVVHLPLGRADGFLLRLSENDHEAAWLRNRTRTATLMRVAHDLRTPIQSLLATAENLLDKTSIGASADGQDARAQLARAAEVALDHISNVLAVIRGEQSATGLLPDEDFSITGELRSLLAMVSPIATGRGAEVVLHLDPPHDVWVNGPVRFVRALCQNMIDNSIKYGGPSIDVHLTCMPAPDADQDLAITVEVRDLGGGLPPEQKTRLQKALGGDATAPTTNPAAPGRAGRPSAGLNVLAHALRQLGGTLEVLDRGADGGALPEETKGPVTGTILRARFTLTAADPPSAARQPDEKGGSLDGVAILLVEDSPASRDWLVHVLQRAGAKVRASGNGKEALALIERPDISTATDLVLTDMTLPYMNGVELAWRIQAGQASGKLNWTGPILGLTAHVDEKIREACHNAGILKVLEKPIRPAELCAAIRDALRPSGQPDEKPTEPAATNGDTDGRKPDESLLSSSVVGDLVDQLGQDGARGFMRRALAEARSVADKLRRDGPDGDSGRLLHAATGACGLTGLTRVERSLRAIELALETPGTDLAPLYADLDAALQRTERAIELAG